MLRCASIPSLQRTVSTSPLVDFRAPRLWIFLSSLLQGFSATCRKASVHHEVIDELTLSTEVKWQDIAVSYPGVFLLGGERQDRGARERFNSITYPCTWIEAKGNSTLANRLLRNLQKEKPAIEVRITPLNLSRPEFLDRGSSRIPTLDSR